MPKASAAHADCTGNPVSETKFDLRLDKRVASGASAVVGDKVRYVLRVSNRGPDAAPAPIVVRDPLPKGLQLISAKGRGWDCTAKLATDKVVCRRDNDLAAGKKAYPIVVVAKVSGAATGRVVNVARVSAAGETSPSNNRDVAAVQVGAVPALPETGFRIGWW